MKKRFLACLCVLLLGVASAENADVAERLTALGYISEQSGDVQSALRAFQQANGLTVTGEADADTCALLYTNAAISRAAYLKSYAEECSACTLLQKGSTGDTVTRLQQRLSELGYYTGDWSGTYDRETARAVSCYQLSCGLTRTGKADASLQQRLYAASVTKEEFLQKSVCRFGDSGSGVRLLQMELKRLEYFDGDCTGLYGELTRRSVYAFQQANGLEMTGIADIDTCNVLYSGNAVGEKLPEDVLYERAARVRERLYELGYPVERDGEGYDEAVMLSLRLFSMAYTDENADDTQSSIEARLMADDALTYDQLVPILHNMTLSCGEDAATAIAATAVDSLGKPFACAPEEMPGFAFVRGVCLDAGVPLVSSDEILSAVRVRLDDYDALEPGEIVVFARSATDWTDLCFGICTQPGFVAYAMEDSGYVLEAGVQRLATGEVSVWKLG